MYEGAEAQYVCVGSAMGWGAILPRAWEDGLEDRYLISRLDPSPSENFY